MKVEFYHTFNIPEKNIYFKGQYDLNVTLPYIDIDVKGKTLLDIACRDGFYSFFFETKGAIVTALDYDDRAARRLMQRLLDSRINFLHKNVYSLKNFAEKTFDITWAGDILCHVENPLGLLRQIHHITKEKFYLVSDYFSSNQPAIEIKDMLYLWKFSEQSLVKLLQLAGFINIKLLHKYKIPSLFGKDDQGRDIKRDVLLIECVRNLDWKLENVLPFMHDENFIYSQKESPICFGELCYEADIE